MVSLILSDFSGFQGLCPLDCPWPTWSFRYPHVSPNLLRRHSIFSRNIEKNCTWNSKFSLLYVHTLFMCVFHIYTAMDFFERCSLITATVCAYKFEQCMLARHENRYAHTIAVVILHFSK